MVSIFWGAVAAWTMGTPVEFGVDLDRVARILDEDVRLVVLGDSFSRPVFQRVPAAMMRVWPIERISAIAGGVAPNANLLQGRAYCEPIEDIDATGGYRVERATTDDEWFGLPISGIREIHCDEQFQIGTQGRFLEQRLIRTHMMSGAHGDFARIGDNLKYRYLYWCPSNPAEMFESIVLADGSEPRLTLDPRVDARKLLHLGEVPDGVGRPAVARQINAAAVDIDAVNDLDDKLTIQIREGAPSVGTSSWVHPAGGVYYHVDDDGVRIPGLYYSYLADNSWSFRGFGVDEPSSASHPKQFTIEELTHWLDVTTLDASQPVMFMVHLAVENMGPAALADRLLGIIDVCEASCASVGIQDVHVLFVTPHMHPVGNLDVEGSHGRLQEFRDVSSSIATSRRNVSAASIYDATGGVWFTGDSTANAWLNDHGYDDFTYGSIRVDLTGDPYWGDLLDAGDLHPQGFDAAAFFADRLLHQVRIGACPANLALDGRLDVFDLIAFLEEFAGETTRGDWNVDGIHNVFDIIEYLEDFDEGCP